MKSFLKGVVVLIVLITLGADLYLKYLMYLEETNDKPVSVRMMASEMSVAEAKQLLDDGAICTIKHQDYRVDMRRFEVVTIEAGFDPKVYVRLPSGNTRWFYGSVLAGLKCQPIGEEK